LKKWWAEAGLNRRHQDFQSGPLISTIFRHRRISLRIAQIVALDARAFSADSRLWWSILSAKFRQSLSRGRGGRSRANIPAKDRVQARSWLRATQGASRWRWATSSTASCWRPEHAARPSDTRDVRDGSPSASNHRSARRPSRRSSRAASLACRTGRVWLISRGSTHAC